MSEVIWKCSRKSQSCPFIVNVLITSVENGDSSENSIADMKRTTWERPTWERSNMVKSPPGLLWTMQSFSRTQC